jgi:HAD superfamily hydrolase (TIGR01458 family)
VVVLNHDFKGLAIDLDGVLFVGEVPIVGAAAAISSAKNAGLLCRFVTNTSTQSLLSLHSKLVRLGFPVEESEIISAPQAALRYLRGHQPSKAALLLAEDARSDFNDIVVVEIEEADFIVLGDIGLSMSCELLNRIFSRMMSGASLIAIHRNRFWQTDAGLQLDIGGYVAALEYCTGRPAVVIGKPSNEFFSIALSDMGLLARDVVMVGDDIDSDIGGAQRMGMFGVLTRTGKFRQNYVEVSQIKPDLIIESISELPAALQIR